jgi:protein-S-isoprenylcysteine O-methyltransferase Ste14
MNRNFLSRGGLWVAAQIVLIPAMLAALFALRTAGVEALWPAWLRAPTMILGGLLLAGAVALLTAAVLRLGANLTAFPRPRAGGALVDSGVYAVVRHPIYTSIIAAMLGITLVLHSAFGIVFTLLTFVFFDRKAASEERMLTAAYADYAAYRKRVRKLIPFVY